MKNSMIEIYEILKPEIQKPKVSSKLEVRSLENNGV